MAVVKLKYTRDKQEIKANLKYFTHRAGRDHEKMTRDIFTNVGQADKQEFYRQVKNAGRGTSFFKFMINPDPKREDSLKDLDLRYITRRTISKMERAVGRRLLFVAAVHNADHTPLRHVHGIFLVQGRLSKEHFRALQEVARAEFDTRGASSEACPRPRAYKSPLPDPQPQKARGHPRQGTGGESSQGPARLHKMRIWRALRFACLQNRCPICRTKLGEERQIKLLS